MTGKIGRPKGAEQIPLREDISHWQWWVKAMLARKGMYPEDLAPLLNLSRTGITHRLSLRAEWPLKDLRTLADVLDIPLSTIIDKYPDLRANPNRYVETNQPS